MKTTTKKEINFKGFKDLEFKKHPHSFGFSTQAQMNFDNGFGVSVITGTNAYTNSSHPYEVAILKDDNLCYTTPITNDVLGYQNENDVTDVMKKVQQLKG